MGKRHNGRSRNTRIATENAEIWVDKLDRSIIGCLAVNTDALVKAQAYFLAVAKSGKQQKLSNAMLLIEFNISNILQPNNAYPDEATEMVKAELWFWWRRSLKSTLIPYTHQDTNEQIESRIRLLEAVATQPEMHPYLEVGMRDVDAILAFINNNIDVELGQSILDSSSGGIYVA